jgi:hypothetical protein
VKPGRWDDRQHAEHLRIVDIRTREGRSAAEIAVELWCSYRTVQRYRLELRVRSMTWGGARGWGSTGTAPADERSCTA